MPRVPVEEIEKQVFDRIMFLMINSISLIHYLRKEIDKAKEKGFEEGSKRVREKLTRDRNRLDRSRHQMAEFERLKKEIMPFKGRTERIKRIQYTAIEDIYALTQEQKKELFHVSIIDKMTVLVDKMVKGANNKPKPKFKLEGDYNFFNAWNFVQNLKNAGRKYRGGSFLDYTWCVGAEIRPDNQGE